MTVTIASWMEQHIPDQTGRIALITGASSGIGLEAARLLAERGARVVLPVRNAARGEAAVAFIRERAPDADLETAALDLSSLASIRAFAEQFLTTHDRLDLLINNAGTVGAIRGPRTLTSDGFDAAFGTNHLGHFALTGYLFPLLLQATAPRVVNTSSNSYSTARLTMDDLKSSDSARALGGYTVSKLANMLFTAELQRKLTAAGSSGIAAAVHPGFAVTNIFSQPGQPPMAAISLMVRVLGQSAAMGALPIVYGAASPAIQGGDYIGPGGFLTLGGFPKKAVTSKLAQDAGLAARLWAVSEELTGVAYPRAGG